MGLLQIKWVLSYRVNIRLGLLQIIRVWSYRVNIRLGLLQITHKVSITDAYKHFYNLRHSGKYKTFYMNKT